MLGIAIGRQLERFYRAGDGDEVGRDHHLVDEPASIVPAQRGFVGAQLRGDYLTEPRDRFGRDPPVCPGQLPLDEQDFRLEIGVARVSSGEAGGEVAVAYADHALLDEVGHVLDRAAHAGAFGAERLELRLPLADDGLQLLVPDAGALIGGLASPEVAGTAIAAVAASLARRDRERIAALAMTALGDAGEHGRPGHDPSGDPVRGTCLPTWTTVAGPGCKGGDSGSPLFGGTIAYGILKGGSCAFYLRAAPIQRKRASPRGADGAAGSNDRSAG